MFGRASFAKDLPRGWRRKLRLMVVAGFVCCGFGVSAAGAQEDALALLWRQAAAQPDDFAIGCERLDAPQDAVRYNASARFPLASITKVLIFTEYAQRLEAGRIPLDETVAVAALERYNLPRTDRGAHDLFMEQYPAHTTTLSLWDVAVGMVQYSSNAASDYLLDRLAPADWGSLYRTLALRGTDLPHSLTLIPLLMNNHETGKAQLSEVADLSTNQGELYLDRYTTDEDWRATEIAYRARRGSDFPDWRTQAAILEQHTALGTVNDFMRVLRAIYGTESPLSERVRAMTRTALRWEGYDSIDARYVEYGSKLGIYSGGTLTLIAYGAPYNSAPVLSVTFFRAIPRDVYRELVREDAIGELAHWMNLNGCGGLAERLPQE